MLRNYLARNADFCEEHIQCDEQAQETWLLHRDILHALIMPVVTLFERASALAEAALCTRKTEDLELAFAGKNNGAKAPDVQVRHCPHAKASKPQLTPPPACVVNAALSTESHIRLTIAASLLSTAAIASPTSPAAVDDESNKSLPPLPHILPALRSALASDPFWNNDGDMWPYLLSRATQLSAGIQALITECVNLESLVSSPTSARPGAAPRADLPAHALLRRHTRRGQRRQAAQE
ncbi:hypothetical protein SNOG_01714 [Parastagonospora nodorum SN15]|uniref:Uncharacterized protein n=1 Tax=Phaeosphaeria nodorum (strain SN15 / ATCC MYA-4574 / FGSC 10173) TaxID=321614 RepID=Q0V2Q0_PHANO|nr:hypothetical protein SNOG_01714 [Parastagonospora nodorum SN15]EAT91363.1 hypothetical protein SNOG_01714 [Parastagonospora nodorum SN15]